VGQPHATVRRLGPETPVDTDVLGARAAGKRDGCEGREKDRQWYHGLVTSGPLVFAYGSGTATTLSWPQGMGESSQGVLRGL